jgi:hypothetical protein
MLHPIKNTTATHIHFQAKPDVAPFLRISPHTTCIFPPSQPWCCSLFKNTASDHVIFRQVNLDVAPYLRIPPQTTCIFRQANLNVALCLRIPPRATCIFSAMPNLMTEIPRYSYSRFAIFVGNLLVLRIRAQSHFSRRVFADANINVSMQQYQQKCQWC